ncbi:sn-glycerol-3-phosphate ABC transporter ATP-binding protein UgpC [Phytohabitans sp. ZYX-F-186]|uniref:Sn-glycerol-3-phosphate ABC transporter ATP-binding protein UgpC n=1 Tax=Phytohabitans maris TaxID=3071409 RepID=A0ABU0ZAC5_9ACTN|nr:sn-glycerol-3-phosphate ABC transporter ATP-binding protein UgpC [Phytohabitans sp. ZYX-F-186]MDQ7904009.1 sn-glycerol-3-phosphate ABC transporter ATP-binding protein UgpC [Phytohabitans sp. ZYX-F-186]
MAEVTMTGVTKVFPGGTVAVDQVNLSITDGEFIVLVGPSGCGKSTLLRMVAGLEDTTDGTIEIGGRVVNDLPPKERDIAMVFQNYALYPHMTVSQNLGFSLRIRGTRKPQVDEQVGETARVLGLTPLLERKPAALSGGQRQRVAMGRAIVRRPQVFLMDEPLSNLDAKLRVAMRGELSRLHQKYGTTTIYVTHDQVEAMTLGNRIAVLDHGRLQQVGPPDELYAAPRNVFVAGFIGSPAMNLATCRVVDDGDGLALALGEHRWPVPESQLALRPSLRSFAGREIVVGLRPAAIEPADGDHGGPRLTVTAVTVESLGGEKNLLFLPPATTARVESLAAEDEGAPSLWTARLPALAPVRAGDEVELAVDLGHAYFFDPESTEALPVTDGASLLAAAN